MPPPAPAPSDSLELSLVRNPLPSRSTTPASPDTSSVGTTPGSLVDVDIFVVRGQSDEELPPRKHDAASLALPLLLPNFLTHSSFELVLPVLPVYGIRTLRATPGKVGLLVAAAQAGTVFGALPGGALTERLFAKTVLILALGFDATSNVLSFATPTVLPLTVIRILAGVGLSWFSIAQATYVTDHVQNEHRGTVQSAVDGSRRWAGILAPALGAYLADAYGVRATFFLQVLFTMAAMFIIAVLLGENGRGGRRRTRSSPASPAEAPVSSDVEAMTRSAAHGVVITTPPAPVHESYCTVFRDSWGPLVRIGTFSLFLFLAREARHLLIVLYGESLQLHQVTIGLVSSLGYLVDALVFPLSGYLMDAFGRRSNGIPSALLLGVGLMLLPLAKNAESLAVIAAFIGLANGVGAGIVLTLGSDLAPRKSRSKFLALYQLIGDVGSMIGPLSAGLIAEYRDLNGGAILAGLSALVAAFWMIIMVPETKGHKARDELVLPIAPAPRLRRAHWSAMFWKHRDSVYEDVGQSELEPTAASPTPVDSESQEKITAGAMQLQ